MQGSLEASDLRSHIPEVEPMALVIMYEQQLNKSRY
jgi:hypothetical protein